MATRNVDWRKWRLGPWQAEVAPHILPILIKQAREGRILSYADLADALHHHYRLLPKDRKTLYGHPVGVVGYALQDLEKKWNERIPPINVLVVRRSTGLPGIGADEIVRYFFREESAEHFSVRDRKTMMEEATQAVWNYGEKWVTVADALGADLLDLESGRIDDEQPLELPEIPAAYAPESKEHKALKNWVSCHPGLFEDFGDFERGQIEHLLASGDRCDAYFDNGRERLAVEVKASNAAAGDMARGVFQVVKYRAVLRAEQRVAGRIPNAHAVLVSTQSPTQDARRLMKRLHVMYVRAPVEAER